MKRIGVKFFTALLFIILAFSPALPFSHGAFGEESEPCWPIYQTGKDTLSAYSEAMRAYALPPAWDNLNQGQEEPATHQIVA